VSIRGDSLEKILSSISGGILSWDNLINFKIILLSIVIEALPFMLLSVFVSAILHNFVAEELIGRIIPKNKLLSIVSAALLGIFIPVCDCGMVPVVRRLVAKGVPLYTAISFMLAAPIINPVVAIATAYAFRGNLAVAFWRLGMAFFIACLTSWVLSHVVKGNALKAETHDHHMHCGCCEHDTHNDPIPKRNFTIRVIHTMHDASTEFFEMGKYLLLGAMLGALVQIIMPRELLLSVGREPFLSVGVMMVFAFVISVCSAADAFIAAAFITSFSPGSLIAFMIFGPMIDLKNTLMLLHGFRSRFVVLLIIIIFAITVTAALLINLFFANGSI
jgi:hypothetical protein